MPELGRPPMTAIAAVEPRPRLRPARARLPLGLLIPGTAAAALALLPLVYLGVRALDDGPGRFAEILWREQTYELLVRSVGLAVVVTAAALVIGTALAWVTVRTDVPARRTWGVLAALPLAVPTYVAGYVWISAVPELRGFWGAFLVLTLCCYPYVYLPVAAALRGLDPALEEVARSLGSSRGRTFRTVTLRQLRPAMAAGALLVSLYVLSDFGAVSILGYDTFTRAIFTSYRASFDRTPAAVLSCVLVAVTVLLVVSEDRTRGRASYARLGTGSARQRAAIPLRRATAPVLAAMGGLVTLTLGVPAASITYWLIRGSSAGLDADRVIAAVTGSISLSLAGAVATTLLALPIGVLAARHARARVARLLEKASWAGHALPGLVVALALVFLAVRSVPAIYQTRTLVVLAYAVLFLPLAVGSVRASAAQSPPRLEEVARSLGSGPLKVLRTVTLPLAAPGIGAGAVLVFLTCMKELPATILLRPTGMDTLATRLWDHTQVAAYADAAPYAALLVVLSAVPTYLLSRSTGVLERSAEQ